jgi:hypothetical protein
MVDVEIDNEEEKQFSTKKNLASKMLSRAG